MEVKLKSMIDHRLNRIGIVLAVCLELAVIFDHLILAGLQDAVETPKYGQRNHHPTVLGRPIRAAQKIGDIPNNIALLFESFVAFH